MGLFAFGFDVQNLTENFNIDEEKKIENLG